MNKYNLFLLFFLAACSPKEHNDAVESVPPNEYLTIIVKNTASHPVRIATEASYIKPAEYSQIAYQQSDTLRLALQPFEEISFSHKGVFMQKTFAGRGDTLILHSSEEKIEYEVKHWNPSIQTMLTAYTDFQNSESMKALAERIDSIQSVFYPIDKNRPFYVLSEYEKMVGYPDVDRDESRFETKRELIEKYFDLVQEKQEKSLSFLGLIQDEVPEELIAAWRSMAERDYFDEVLRFNGAGSSAYDPELMRRMNADFYHKDDILLHPYARKFLTHYIRYHVAPPKKGRSGSAAGSFYSTGYDLTGQHFTDTAIVKYIQYLCINGMAEQQQSFKSVEEKYRQFKDTYQDSRFNEILESRYLFDFEKYAQLSDDLQLIDGKRTLTSLSDLLEKAKGKLVYIDFWASWCAPCRVAMPASRQLKKDYENKGVIFVYLSTDQDIDAWGQAVKAEKLDNFTFNYLIVNQQSSDFIKQIHLTTIPRYLLFDQQGVLVHQNAPGPDSPELIALLDRYLNE